MIKTEMKQLDNLYEIVYTLLDNYYRHGYIYDETGQLKEVYEYVFMLQDGFLYDYRDQRIDEIPYYAKFYCPEKNKNLWVHSNDAFSDMDWQEVLNLSTEEILDKYLSDHIDKLINMLKKGNNLATRKGFGMQYSDQYLAQTIAFIWKMFAIQQIDCRNIKRKFYVKDHDYYADPSVTYKWDERPYSSQLSDPDE